MESSNTAAQVLEAMAAAEPSAAATGLERLTSQLETAGGGEVDLETLWVTFKRLLHRRGYFVSSSAELSRSLEEIHAVGEGFDLYDLALGLARFDLLRMERVGIQGHRSIPELKVFTPSKARKTPRKEK
jgi:hypothetical protein